jgi:hypothetical protein
MHTIAAALFVGIPIAVFVVISGAILLGKHIARRGALAEGASSGNATVEGAILGLFGLLVAFSFSGAETRLDARRQMIVDEANAIGTAYLRLDMLPAADQHALKEDFRRYVDARIAFYANLLDLDAADAQRKRVHELQRQIWNATVQSATRAPDSRVAMIVLPAINEMIDLTTAREAAIRIHIPVAIFVLLGIMAVACGVLAGVGMGRSGRTNLIYVFAFAGTMAMASYVILNLEFPRLGFVRFEAIDALLVEVRAEMH